jgi:hypothetical protein
VESHHVLVDAEKPLLLEAALYPREEWLPLVDPELLVRILKFLEEDSFLNLVVELLFEVQLVGYKRNVDVVQGVRQPRYDDCERDVQEDLGRVKNVGDQRKSTLHEQIQHAYKSQHIRHDVFDGIQHHLASHSYADD